MERVAFLVEPGGERIACMLNPESLVMRRWTGVRPMRPVGALAAGNTIGDDPLLQTGGGTTEVVVDLLFDVSLAEGPAPLNDVRDLTRPLWQLSENARPSQPGARVVRFVWGKTWNVRVVIAAIAERVESFDGDGAPGRSWLRMRMLRIDDPAPREQAASSIAPQALAGAETQMLQIPPLPESAPGLDAVPGEESVLGDDAPPVRFDNIAWESYGDCSVFKDIAEYNGIEDPFRLERFVLELPSLAELRARLPR
jgi:hypothetical protein